MTGLYFIITLSLDLDGIGWSTPRAGCFTQVNKPGAHSTGVWFGLEAVWTGTENLAASGFRSPTFQLVASYYTI
jgi:hypothetical protein